jgi:hypothetical protein
MDIVDAGREAAALDANSRSLTGARKADFGGIYGSADPRGYYRALMPLGYQIPQRARPVFERLLACSAARAGQRRTILDVCCSYGINAALLRCELDLAALGERYLDPQLDTLSPAQLLAADREFYRQHRRVSAPTVLGVDSSAPAIDYALQAGILCQGWAEDLESEDPSPALAAGVGDVGLIVCTGGVGYIGPRTFERVLASIRAPEQLWVAVFVLRVFSYDDIAASLARYGLVTEQIPGLSVPQRRFADPHEAHAAVQDVRRRGLDPRGKEADGWFYADGFLSRPARQVSHTPLTELLNTPT